MSIRVTALFIFVAFLIIYAWKDWFKSLCGLILLMAVIEHEDMPKSIFGIQGFNLWNLLMLVIVLAWLVSRRREGLTWDMPRHVNILLLLYLGVILIGWLRAVFDRSYIEDYPLKSLISEELINTFKWVIPGILLFYGCRTRKRVIIALFCILTVYLIVAIQVARFMPPSAVTDFDTMSSLRVRLGRYIGYSACDISAMLAGASWAVIATLPLIRQWKYRVLIILAGGIITFGQALTGGRAGYLAWGVTGLILCLLKWRKYLVFVPLVVVLLPMVFPSATARMFSGFGEIDVAGDAMINDDAMTSGRTLMWPYVINKITEAPLIGYGRLAMVRTGLADRLRQIDLNFPHPHNVYLETLLDNGILGSLMIFLFWATILVYSVTLFRNSNCLFSAIGGITLSLVLAQIVAGIGAQHYYPRISTVGMWASGFLMLRVYIEEKQIQTCMIVSEFPQEEKPEYAPNVYIDTY
jgi:O-antigen ligase